MEIVLYSPQIPQNTGNILRTASVTGLKVSLIRPLGFSLSDKALRRAGLDYVSADLFQTWGSWEEFLEAKHPQSLFFFSSKGKDLYSETSYPEDSFLVFGSETEGLPLSFYDRYASSLYRIPMLSESRCLNLASSVAIVSYEALKQQGFPKLS